jgi:hypothetical protein
MAESPCASQQSHEIMQNVQAALWMSDQLQMQAVLAKHSKVIAW